MSNSFQSCDAKAILATPIPRRQVCDRITWTNATDGKYSVKSGYKYWHSNFSTCRRVNISQGWSNLWKLEIPHKVKIFIWRLCRNNVPVRKVLRSRGVQTPIMCLMCGDDVEHLLHLFLDCSFAQECWGLMGLSFDVLSIEDFQEWLLDKLTTGSKDSKVQLVTVLWTVWNARNLKVWEGKVIASSIALQWSNSHIV